MGNLLMSGITNDTREITLMGNDTSALLTPVPSINDFISLFTLEPTCGKGCDHLRHCFAIKNEESQHFVCC